MAQVSHHNRHNCSERSTTRGIYLKLAWVLTSSSHPAAEATSDCLRLRRSCFRRVHRLSHFTAWAWAPICFWDVLLGMHCCPRGSGRCCTMWVPCKSVCLVRGMGGTDRKVPCFVPSSGGHPVVDHNCARAVKQLNLGLVSVR